MASYSFRAYYAQIYSIRRFTTSHTAARVIVSFGIKAPLSLPTTKPAAAHLATASFAHELICEAIRSRDAERGKKEIQVHFEMLIHDMQESEE